MNPIADMQSIFALLGHFAETGRGRQERLGLNLDSLGKKLPGAGPENVRQGIVDLASLTKPDNIAILIPGVSLLKRGSGRLPHFSNRHHPVLLIAPRHMRRREKEGFSHLADPAPSGANGSFEKVKYFVQ